MSIRVMSAVYDGDLTDIYEHAVMLALANHADDDGRCYPSIARVAFLARCSERKVQGVIKTLSLRGYIEVKPNAGPRGCNLFHLHATPAHHAPRTPCPPHTVQEPPHTTTLTPAHPAPEPSGTIINHQDTTAGADKPPPKHRLPDGWMPSDEDMAYALKQGLTENEITEIGDEYATYWQDRNDRDSRKSQRGWASAWRNNIRRVAPQWKRNRSNRGPSGYAPTGGRGPDASLASIVARRRIERGQ